MNVHRREGGIAGDREYEKGSISQTPTACALSASLCSTLYRPEMLPFARCLMTKVALVARCLGLDLTERSREYPVVRY